jgi:TolA-binding protein
MMAVTNDLMYELLKRMQGDLAELKRGQLSMGLQLASMEQHAAASQVEIARMSGDIAQLNRDMSLVKRCLDLVDA